ncbi:MAG: DUF58 domain-containing protein [Eubacteriales bacterium]|nr:DUF58 domain-containing protein [Eubacteriales bacterium]
MLDALFRMAKWIADFFSSKAFGIICLSLIVIWLLYMIFKYYLKVRAGYIEKLEYSRSFSEEGVHAGDTVILVETVANNSWFPLFGVEIGFYVNSGLEIDGVKIPERDSMFYFASRFHFMPHSRVTRSHKVKCLQRRAYYLETAEVYADGEYRYLTAPVKFYVYPETMDNINGILPATNTVGEFDTKNRFISDPFRMSGLRPYQYGDPFNRVNFKASARAFRGGRRELIVNNHDSSSQFNMMIYFNFTVARSSRLLPDEARELAEVGLIYASAMIEKAAACGGRVGFASNSYLIDKRQYIRFAPDGTKAHMIEILKSLSTIEAIEGSSFAALLDADMNTTLYDMDICIITYGVDDELDKRIRLLRQYNKSVNILLLAERKAAV